MNHPQQLSPDDLPDFLDTPRGAPDATDENLLSQMAGDDIDRMLSTSGTFPITGRGAVEQLTSQLGSFFQELGRREREAIPPPPPDFVVQEEQPIEELVPAERAAADPVAEVAGAGVFDPRDEPTPAQALLAPMEAEAPEPLYLKPLDWISDPIASLSEGARAAVSVTALLSFVSSCAALAYVLMLRSA